jgi:hypothetical protein
VRGIWELLGDGKVGGIKKRPLLRLETWMKMGLHTFVPPFSIAPRYKIMMISSFFHIGQLSGSLGSSLGGGERTISLFLPVPCLRYCVKS